MTNEDQIHCIDAFMEALRESMSSFAETMGIEHSAFYLLSINEEDVDFEGAIPFNNIMEAINERIEPLGKQYVLVGLPSK